MISEEPHKNPQSDKDKEMYKYAVMAKASYDHYENKQNVEQTNQELQKYLPEHELVAHLSDDHSVVIRHKDKPEVTIAYRGTQLNVGDLATDAQIMLSKPLGESLGTYLTGSAPTPLKGAASDFIQSYGTGYLQSLGRFHEADMKYQRTKQAFPNAEVSVTGHSMGGAQGAYINKKHDAPAYLFNVFDPTHIYHDTKNKPKVYHTPTDLLTIPATMDNVTLVQPKEFLKNLKTNATQSLGGYLLLGVPAALTLAAGQSVWDFHDLANFLPPQVFALEHKASPKINKAIYNTAPVQKLKHASGLVRPYSMWLYPKLKYDSTRHLTKFDCDPNERDCELYL